MTQYCVLASEGRQRYSIYTKTQKNIKEKKKKKNISDFDLTDKYFRMGVCVKAWQVRPQAVPAGYPRNAV
jgi:hypothetical protein